MKYKIYLNTLLFLFITMLSFSQQTITGIVTIEDSDEPLLGVSVILKNTSIGVVTDFDGNFSINAPADGTLVFSYVGFLTKEVPVNNKTNLQVTLREDVTELDAVVVIGYGTQKKSDLTGSVATVKTSEIQRIPLARTDEVLQGQVAGVEINNNDASPNGNVSIRIRGASSISASSDPLIIVDGLQGAVLSDVHPNDISSIQVLKDASATAIYGSRGAGGVIIITTNKGIKGSKPTLKYNTFTTIQTIRKKLDLLSPGQYAQFINENRAARSLPLPFSNDEIAGFDAGGGTDWQDEIFRTGISVNHYLNVSGGSDNTSYSISGEFLETKGIVVNTGFRRFSFRPNISMSLNDKLKLNFYSSINLSKDNPILLNTRGQQGSPIFAAFRFSPTRPVFNPDGTYSQPGDRGVGPNTEFNPLALAVEPIRDNYSNRLVLNPYIEYELVKGLKASVSGSYQLIDDEFNFYNNERIINGNNSDREAFITNSKFTSFQNTNNLTYKVDLGNHNLTLTGVFEQQKSSFNINGGGGRGFSSNSTTYNNLGLAETPVPAFSNVEEQSLESYLGRFNYSYDDRYLLTFSARSDAASVFAENNKRAFFSAVAGAWNISNEKFLVNSKVIDNLKLRGGYGEVGNAAIQPYQSLAQLQTGQLFSFNGTTVINGANLSPQAPNPDLKWETSEQFNVGLDLSMFNGRFSLTADYYEKNTSDLLLQRTLTQASGFQTQLINAGSVENKGLEILLSAIPVRTKSFEWNSTVIFSKNVNEVTSLDNNETELLVGGAGLPGFQQSIWLEVGQPIGLIRGFEYDGVYTSDEELLANLYGVTPGSPKYVDQNNDGQINNEDIVNIANALPDFNFSWNNTFKYKGIDLNVLVIGVEGKDIYNIAQSLIEDPVEGTGINLLNVWSPSNENTNIPGHNAQGIRRNSSRWVEDGSFIRVKNITLGYNLPLSLTQSLGISSIRVYATGTNLFTITDYSGFDPESNNAGDLITRNQNNRDTFGGIDLASYPSQKRYTLGLDVKL